MVKTRRNILSSSSSSAYYYYSEKAPQFFKIYLPDHCSQRLRIPQAFIKYFKGVIPFKSILRSHAKRSWHVNVKRFEDFLVFEQGWPTFVEDNSLKFGDFLIFSYHGNSEFNVTVFGQNNCQKEVAITMESDKALACKSEEIRCQDNEDQKTLRSRTSLRIQENIGALQTPSNFDSENPFFENVLKPTYAHGRFMNIPLGFVTRYMRKHTPTATLKRSNKSWRVNLIRHSGTLAFCAGWRKFLADNDLKEGDTYRFELIRRDGYIFNVSILRAKFKKTRGVNRIVRGTKMIGRPRDQPAIKEKVGAFEGSSKFISKHPFFQIVLSPAYVHKGLMHIPADFWRRYMDKPSESAMLEYSNKLWPVNLKCRSMKLNFCGGWSNFVKGNNLRVGNVCCFELIERENHVFKVSVKRGMEDVDSM